MKKRRILIIALISIIFAGMFLTSCEKSIFYIIGEGEVVTQTLDLQDITKISNNGSLDVVVTQGDSQEIVVVGHQNIIDRLKTNVIDGKWNVELQRGNYRNFELTVYITIPTVEKIRTNGSGDIEISGFNNLGNLELHISGSGDMIVSDTLIAENLDLEIQGSGFMGVITSANSVDTQIMGSGDIEIVGETSSETIEINGSGNYKAFDLLSNVATVKISGSGDTQINAENSLDVKIWGSGDVYYIGAPSMTINVAGSGSVISWN